MSGEPPRIGGLDQDALLHVAHALKNPLAAVIGYSELLLHHHDEPAILEEAPRYIHEAAGQLAAVVEDLVVVLAANAGTLEPDVQAVDLAQEVDRAVAQTDGGRPEVVCRSRPVVLGDLQYLPHLLANVLRAARRLGEASEICVVVDQSAGGAELSVSITGAHLSDDERDRMFELAAKGLELHAARWLVHLHGGTIAAHAMEHGTTLHVTLPLAGAPAS